VTADDAQVSVDTLREDISTDAVLVTVHAADVRAVLDRFAKLADVAFAADSLAGDFDNGGRRAALLNALDALAGAQ